MSKVRNIIKQPIWKKSDLGLPLPDSKHAVSVALPTWKDVIDYEEKDPICIESLKSIYPRFGLNPLLKTLSEEVLTKYGFSNCSAWPYSNDYIALKAKKFCDSKTKLINSFLAEKDGIHFLITKSDASYHARIFWQHTGLGASSREAAISLGIENKPSKTLVNKAYRKIVDRISRFTETNPKYINLTSSGMSAFHTALEIIYKVFPKKPTLQIGFPYVDVLKLPMNIFYGANLITEENYENIESRIKDLDPAALIIELPSNPMLKCANIKKIAEIGNKLNIPIITDDTIGSNLNIDSLLNSDIVFTSLTKIFSGSGDILAGSFILNPKSKWINQFQYALKDINMPLLSDGDIVALEKSSRDIDSRVFKQNLACLELKRRLENHPSIKEVFHPEHCPNFNSIIKKNGGYGCLLSFELEGGLKQARSFYDSLEVSKGPSLGTQFTLVCPYVQLAHYNELNWAESLGIPSHLIRVSVGLEDKEILWNIFSKALDKVKL